MGAKLLLRKPGPDGAGGAVASGMACNSVGDPGAEDGFGPHMRWVLWKGGSCPGPLFSFSPAPNVGAGRRLSCFGCSAYSCSLICARSVPLGRAWVAQPLCSSLVPGGALGLGLRAYPSLWGRALAAAPVLL